MHCMLCPSPGSTRVEMVRLLSTCFIETTLHWQPLCLAESLLSGICEIPRETCTTSVGKSVCCLVDMFVCAPSLVVDSRFFPVHWHFYHEKCYRRPCGPFDTSHSTTEAPAKRREREPCLAQKRIVAMFRPRVKVFAYARRGAPRSLVCWPRQGQGNGGPPRGWRRGWTERFCVHRVKEWAFKRALV